MLSIISEVIGVGEVSLGGSMEVFEVVEEVVEEVGVWTRGHMPAVRKAVRRRVWM